MKVAIIGSGKVGGNLGIRLAQRGNTVFFGVKPGKDASALLERAGPEAEARAVAQAVRDAEVVFLAVPANIAVDAARAAGDLAGKIVVDCTNPLRWDAGPVHDPPAEGSNAAALAAAFPRARVVKGFNTFGAEFHLDPSLGDRSVDVYLAGDDRAAKTAVAQLARDAGFTPVDSGPLRNAALLENLAVLWIHLAMVEGRGRNFAFKILNA